MVLNKGVCFSSLIKPNHAGAALVGCLGWHSLGSTAHALSLAPDLNTEINSWVF